jgi:hypothetical protein
MTDAITQKMSFVRAAVREHDLSYITMVLDEYAAKRAPHSILFQWDAGRFQKINGVQWNTVGLDVFRQPRPAVVALGEFGKVIIAGPGILKIEEIGIVGSSEDRIVPMRALKVLNAKIYAVGMRRQAYLRTEQGVWKPIHGDMLCPLESDVVKGFETIDGFGDTELYAAGWEGEIWEFNGSSWKQIVSPTNLTISSLCGATDGKIYACGQAGLLLRGRHEAWEIIDTEKIKEDFWSIVCFKGRIYISGFRHILELTDDGLIEVKEASALTDSFYALSTNGEVLWSTGSKAVLSFDGERWLRII